mgnify:CR=1 FL=1
MNLFFDTSALVKFFHDEPGTESVTSLIMDPATGYGCLNWPISNSAARYTGDIATGRSTSHN